MEAGEDRIVQRGQCSAVGFRTSPSAAQRSCRPALQPDSPDSAFVLGLLIASSNRRNTSKTTFEQVAEHLLASDATLRKEFQQRLTNPAFAQSPTRPTPVLRWAARATTRATTATRFCALTARFADPSPRRHHARAIWSEHPGGFRAMKLVAVLRPLGLWARAGRRQRRGTSAAGLTVAHRPPPCWCGAPGHRRGASSPKPAARPRSVGPSSCPRPHLRAAHPSQRKWSRRRTGPRRALSARQRRARPGSWLRKGVRFHDGRPLSAYDVQLRSRWCWHRTFTPGPAPFCAMSSASSKTAMSRSISTCGVDRPRSRRAEAKFRSSPPPIFRWSFDPKPWSRKPCTGPYRFVEWKRDSQIALRRFRLPWTALPLPRSFASHRSRQCPRTASFTQRPSQVMRVPLRYLPDLIKPSRRGAVAGASSNCSPISSWRWSANGRHRCSDKPRRVGRWRRFWIETTASRRPLWPGFTRRHFAEPAPTNRRTKPAVCSMRFRPLRAAPGSAWL